MKRFISILVFLLLLALPALSPVLAITDIDRPALTRIWVNTDQGERFICTASYIQPYINEAMSWIITAGHCQIGDIAGRNADTTVRGSINWRASLREYGTYSTKVQDVAIGTVPDTRDDRIPNGHERLWLATEDSAAGDRVYIHGFPQGIEKVIIAKVADPNMLGDIQILISVGYEGYVWKSLWEVYPVQTVLIAKSGEILGGSSGSPVMNMDGRLSGVLWGSIPWNTPYVVGIPEGYDLILYTPISNIKALMDLLGVR